MDITILWACIGIVFLILEFFTATTYGLDLAIGAFVTAIFAKLVWAENVDIIQILIFGIVSIVLAIVFPKIFKSKSNPIKIGAKAYIGKKAELFKNDDAWKIKFDGVEYLVSASDKRWFRNGKQVQVVSTEWSVLIVQKVQ